jgi:hypothetical protein
LDRYRSCSEEKNDTGYSNRPDPSSISLFRSVCNSAQGQQNWPTTEQFMSSITACATNLNIQINGDLQGSIKSFYEGTKTQGHLTSDSNTQFLSLFPENQRLDAYKIYTECLLKIIVQTHASKDRLFPSVSRVQLFDEQYVKIIQGSDLNGARAKHTLTKLEERSGNNYLISTPENFFFALGFVISGLEKSDDNMNADIDITGLANDGAGAAWTENVNVNHEFKWKKFDIPKTVGPQAVLDYFEIKDDEHMPFAVIIECLDAVSLYRWSGGVQIHLQDHLNGELVAELGHPFFLNLTKPPDLAPPKKSCT